MGRLRRKSRSVTHRRLFRLGLLAAAVLLAIVACNPTVRTVFRYARPPDRYLVPVAGLDPSSIVSTWGAARSGGRKHRGVDLFAPRGTRVVAATDGLVLSTRPNALGGKVVHLLGEGLTLHYYAHLDDWADGLRRGDHVRAGDLLGYVGNSGNAATTPAHLHFGLTRIEPIGFRRVRVDPAPILRMASASR